MELLLVGALLLVLCFGFVVAFGAPYLPTLKPQIGTALDMLDLKPGQTMLELGSGDGRVLKAAAERGWKAVGYELNPLLVLVSLWVTRKQRANVQVKWGNALTAQWPTADGIYIFGLKKIMPKLHTKIVQSSTRPVSLVSFAFMMPGKKPVAEKSGVYLYHYAAKK